MKDPSTISTLEMAAINPSDLAASDVATLAVAMAAGSDPTDVLERVTRFLGRRLEATECSCLLVDSNPSGRDLVYAADAFRPELRGRRLTQRALSYEIQAVLERGMEWSGDDSGELPDDPDAEQTPPPVLRGSLTESEARSSDSVVGLIVPLVEQRQVVGVQWIGGRRSGEPYTEWEVSLSQCAGALAAQSVGVLLRDRANLEMDRARSLEHQRQLEKLDATVAKLRDTIEVKDRELSIYAHDMRTPIGVIQGHLHVLRNMTEASSGLRKSFDAIQRQTERLLVLVDDILDDRRQRALSLRLESCDLGPLVRAWAEDFTLLAQRDGVQLEVEIAADLGIRRIDSDKLADVVTNVVDNAIKYSLPDGIVTLSVDMVDDEQLRFRISDTGPGLTEDELESGFDLYYRGQKEDSVPGTGVGLAAVTQYVQLLGGRVAARNTESGGAEFTIIVPAYRDDLATDDTNPLPVQVFRVLVIDPDRRSLQRAAEALSPQYAVLTARTEREAQWLLQQTPVDCAVIEVNAPLMTGFATAAELRRDPSRRDLPVLFTSASDVSETSVRRHGDIATEVIAKPLDPDELVQRVTESIAESVHRAARNADSRIDPLTGLTTGPEARAEIDRQLQLSRTRRAYLTLLFVGVDHLEVVAERHGRDAAEALLKEYAEILARLALGRELVARWLEDEFLCILPNTSSASGKVVAERIRERLARSHVGAVETTVSIGVASVSARDEVDADRLVARAQEALETARLEGGDRVVVWRRPPEHVDPPTDGT